MVRQLPLFAQEPASPNDITQRTPLKFALPHFVDSLRRTGKSDHTLAAFSADLGLLADYAGEHTPLGQLRTSALNAFLTWMDTERGVPCSRKTYARRVTSLKVFFKWLHGLGVLPNDPALPLLQRSGAAPLQYALSPDEIRRVVAYAATVRRRKKDHDLRPRLLFWLLLDTGIKKHETMALTRADVEAAYERGGPVLRVAQKDANAYRERLLPLDLDWVRLLDDYMPQYGVADVLFPCTPRNLEYVLTDLGEGAGLPVKLSFEVMRWTSAVRDLRQGVAPDAIREKLGLSRISWGETGAKVQQLAAMQGGVKTI